MKKRVILKFILECALIFISIISAFLIENRREVMEEKKKELQLVQEIIQDLQDDSIQYVGRIRGVRKLRNQLTGLIIFLESKTGARPDSVDDSALLYSVRLMTNPTTYQTIQNTGGFRYLNDNTIITGLSSYYNGRQFMVDQISEKMFSIEVTLDKFMVDKTRLVDFDGQISFKIDDQSLNNLRGNQELINICYLKRSFLDQIMLGGFKTLAEMNSDIKHKCSQYLDRNN